MISNEEDFLSPSEISAHEEKLKNIYGEMEENWGDLPNFQGNFINFGYWYNVSSKKIITVEDRVRSSSNLYRYIFCLLAPSKTDSVLEVGCGRGAGILELVKSFQVGEIIGIDISREQIQYAKKIIAHLSSLKDQSTFIQLKIASAYFTGLPAQSIDKVFSVEVAQHFISFSSFAQEMKRILKSKGKLIFTAHLSTSQENLQRLKQENLLIDPQLDVLTPIDVVMQSFIDAGFNVEKSSIGEQVFEGYEQWITQIDCKTKCSHKIYEAFKKGLIDYYVVVATL